MTFKLHREAAIPAQGVIYQEFHDEASGAKHIHLKSDSDENCFMVSFPTVPRSHDGRAHILEHLSLCGSAKYPTRDPFFAMTRRSLATFMNAMTGADVTMYPFASQGRKDFFNLLDVYLDAAFFPNLERIDFLQEGWRLALDEHGKASYNGVVFNEMKEPLSNPGRATWHGLQAALKPGTTYAFESGGDPLHIPELTHEELKEFHATHYHPSRATFWTYGNIDPRDIQARIESEVISKATDKIARIQPDSAAAPTSIREVNIPIPAQEGSEEHGFAISWLLGESAKDPDAVRDWQLFFHAIAGDSASPMSLAVEGAGFGREGLVGFTSQQRQSSAHLGMDGLTREEIPAAKALLLNTLSDIARDGIPESRLRSILRKFEVANLEVKGSSGMPHGLASLYSMVSIELNGGDPLRTLDVQASLAKSLIKIQDAEFIKGMARQLLDSEARIESTTIPDLDFLPSRERQEAAALAKIEAEMTPEQKTQIIEDSAQLLARQRAKPDFSSLPKIEPKDIERQPSTSLPLFFTPALRGPSTAFVPSPTNGVEYFGLVVDASRVAPADWAWLSLGVQLSMSLGFGDKDFEQAALYRSERGSGFGAALDVDAPRKGSDQGMSIHINYSAKGLTRESASMAQALGEILSAPRFDEDARIAFLIQSSHQEMLKSISQSGSTLASDTSAMGMGGLSSFMKATGGMASYDFSRELDSLSRSPEGLAVIKDRLTGIFEQLSSAPIMATYFGDEQGAIQAFAQARKTLSARVGFPSLTSQEFPIPTPEPSIEEPMAIHGPGQLNYCHARWVGPTDGHEDVGPAMVLGAYLRNTFLHRVVREEGGAYGGSASYSAGTCSFSMSSYRDPRLGGTFSDFESAVAAATHGEIAEDDLSEAIVSVMQSLDKPGTPHSRAKASLARGMAGITQERRESLRSSILQCSESDLRRIAKTYLDGKPASKAAYVCPKSADEANELGMRRRDALSAPAGQTRQAPKL